MSEKKQKKRFNITLPDGDYQDLQRLAKARGDDTATRAAYFVQRSLEESRERGEIPAEETIALSREELDQIRDYIRLLIGERAVKNGVSFQEVGELLDLDPELLKDHYEFVIDCRSRHPEEV